MAKQFIGIEPHHREFILQQRIFFTASAAAQGRVNVSPKDGAALRILNPNSVAYLDQTGSGNETAAHLRANGRLTIMFCAFAGAPMILRLYGQGKILSRGSLAYSELLAPGRARSWCLPLIWSRLPVDMEFRSFNTSTNAKL
jgi:Pyridoxamine 5'-phosphate oxidase